MKADKKMLEIISFEIKKTENQTKCIKNEGHFTVISSQVILEVC